MSLLALAVWSNNEPRISYTKRTIESLFSTVDLRKHRLIISDNGSCQEMQDYFQQLLKWKTNWTELSIVPPNINFEIIYNGSNLGTAKAINAAWKFRKPGENCIKMDDDCIVNQRGWVDEMEEVIARYPKCGLLGLKRNDLWEHPDHPEPYWRTVLKMIPHEIGKQDYIIEKSHHIMGTCTMASAALVDKVGGYVQEGVYGFDDSLYSLRAQLAGFETAFLPHIRITNIDEGDAVESNKAYTQWKKDYAGTVIEKYHQLSEEFRSGKRSIYEPL